MERGRHIHYAMLTATAAALGLLLLRVAFSPAPSLAFEFFTNRLTYVYVFAVTAVVFMVLGYVLGRQIDELRRLSSTDSLTDWRTVAFQMRLRDEWRRTRRYRAPTLAVTHRYRWDSSGLMTSEATGSATVLRDSGTRHQYDDAGNNQYDDAGNRCRGPMGGDEFAIVAPNTSRNAASVSCGS